MLFLSSIEAIREDVEHRLEKYGQSLESLKKKSLEQTPEKKGLMLSREECLTLALEEVTDKQSGFRKEEVIGHAMKAGLGHYTAEEFTRDFENHCTIQELGSQMQLSGRTKSAEVTFYTTEDILKTEAGIIKWAEDGRGKSGIAVSSDKVQNHAEAIEEGRKLTKGQREAVEMICTTKDRLSIVQGDAGRGRAMHAIMSAGLWKRKASRSKALPPREKPRRNFPRQE